MLRILLFCLVFSFLPTFLQGQDHQHGRDCFSSHYLDYLKSQDENQPSKEEIYAEFNKLVASYKIQKSLFRTSEEVYKIPIIVHVVHNGESIGSGANISAAQVYSQIDVLNEDFRRKSGTPGFNNYAVGADIGIEFVPALRDPNGLTLEEPGIRRYNSQREGWTIDDIENILKPDTYWDISRYANIWTVRFSPGTTTLGYAYFPGGSTLAGIPSGSPAEARDGIVVRFTAFGRTGNVTSPFNKGRTATHEFGHWLGLLHIWGDGDCSKDDFCADTPLAGAPNYGCPSGVNSCETSPPDMIENYMDYTDDACMNIFTQDQKDRMITALLNSPRRNALLSSNVADPTAPPVARISIDNGNICTGSIIRISDITTPSPNSTKTYVLNANNEIVFQTEANSFEQTFNEVGVFSIAHVAVNDFGTDSLFSSQAIKVLANDMANIPYQEDFEAENFLENWLIWDQDADGVTWKINNSLSAFGQGSKSIEIDNYSSNDDLSGRKDALISEKIEVAPNISYQLSFDLAYAPFNSEFFDSLKVLISTDCGENWHLQWQEFGSQLATADATTLRFIPQSFQWKNVNVPIEFAPGTSSFHIKILHVSGWGNMLYLDNIKIESDEALDVVALFEANQTDVCVGEIIQFNNLSTGNPGTIIWEFEGGTPATSSEINPQVSYAEAGTFGVKLTVSTGNTTDVLEIADYITIKSAPLSGIFWESRDLCYGDSVLLFSEFLDQGDLEWLDEEGNVLGSEEEIMVSMLGNRTIRLRTTNADACSTTSEISLQILEPEIANIIVNLDQVSYCSNGSISGTALFGSGFNITWSSADGELLATGDFVNFPVPNNSQIIVEIQGNSNCKRIDTLNIQINEVLDLSIEANQLEVCAGGNVTLSASSGFVEWEWRNSDNEVISTQESVLISNIQAPVMYFLIATDANGCTQESEVSIDIGTLDGYSLAESFEVCPGESTSIQAEISNGYQIQWALPSGEIISEEAIFEYTFESDVVLSVTISDPARSCVENLEVPILLLDPAPTPTIIQNANTLISSEAETYQWFFNEEAIEGATNRALAAIDPGEYMVRITDANTCEAFSEVFEFIPLNALYESNLQVYPNPGSSYFIIKGLDSKITFPMRLISISGVVAWEGACLSENCEINLENLNSGLYYLQVNTDQGLVNRKVMIQK